MWEYEKKEYLTIQETCNLLGITRQTLNNWFKKGKVKRIQLVENGKVLIPSNQFFSKYEIEK